MEIRVSFLANGLMFRASHHRRWKLRCLAHLIQATAKPPKDSSVNWRKYFR